MSAQAAATTQNIAGRVKEHANLKADARFCTFLHGGDAVSISFGDLFERSSAFARAYRQHGVQPGDLVIVILQHTPHLFYSYLGAILAGAIPSFMPFPSPKQRPDIYWQDHDALFKRIDPRLIVTYEENFEAAKAALPHFSTPVLIASDALLATAEQRSAELSGLVALPESVACLQHSSGTTGLKKGVMLTHAAIFREVTAYAQAIGFGEDEVIASWLPLYHDMGFIGCFMTSVITGSHLVALDPFEWVMRPTQLLDAIQQYRATFTWLPNFAFSHIANSARRGAQWDLSSMRAFINCSEPCRAETFEKFLQRFSGSGVRPESLQVCYAMAENVFAVTQTALDRAPRVLSVDAARFESHVIAPPREGRPARALLSCGGPVEGVEVQIRSAGGAAAEDGHVGEVYLRSPFMFDGYYRQPEKTQERLRDGWYRTGDMGTIHEGELYITGRTDDMLIVNGRNYYAHEIESIVNGVPGTIPGRSVAIGVRDPRTDSTVVVVLAECRESADDSQIAVQVKRAVTEAVGLALHSVVVLNSGEMIKTTSGKISRSKNAELYMNGTLAGRGARHGA